MKTAGWRRIVKLAVIGAVAFWLPDAVWHLVRGDTFGRVDVLGVTTLTPITLLVAYLIFWRRNWAAGQEFKAWPLMLGVWELGGYFMLLSASFQHAGFKNLHGFSDIAMALLLPLIPIYTFIMATYDGSLAALIIVSAAALVMFFAGLGRRSRQHR